MNKKDKVYNVKVNITGEDDFMEYQTEWKPNNLFLTRQKAVEYKKSLYDSFVKEFPRLEHSLTENHACIYENGQGYYGNPLRIWIEIEELEVHD